MSLIPNVLKIENIEILYIDIDGIMYLSLRRLCKLLNINFNSQYKKIVGKTNHNRFNYVYRHIIIDNIEQYTLFISIHSLEHWVNSINRANTKANIEHIIKHQNKGMKLLTNHFKNKSANNYQES